VSYSTHLDLLLIDVERQVRNHNFLGLASNHRLGQGLSHFRTLSGGGGACGLSQDLCTSSTATRSTCTRTTALLRLGSDNLRATTGQTHVLEAKIKQTYLIECFVHCNYGDYSRSSIEIGGRECAVAAGGGWWSVTRAVAVC